MFEYVFVVVFVSIPCASLGVCVIVRVFLACLGNCPCVSDDICVSDDVFWR